MIVERPMKRCDDSNEDIYLDNEHFLLYAWGNSNTFGMHTERGSQAIYLK
jgi:hypothetical protein